MGRKGLKSRLLLALGAVLGASAAGYLVWLSFEPDRFLSELSRETGLRITARATSGGIPYRLTYDDLRIAPPPGRGSGGLTVKIDHLVLSARGLHAARVHFRGVHLGSSNPLQNLALSAFDIRKGSFFVREDPARVVLKDLVMVDPALSLSADGALLRGSPTDGSHFRIRFVMEAHGGLVLFLGTGKQPGTFWGDGRGSHLKVGGRSYF